MISARSTLGLAGAALAAFLVAGPAAADTFLKLTGDPGEPLTGGQTYLFTLADGTFFMNHNSPNAANARFTSATQNWSLDFAGGFQRTLLPGVYLGAVRYPFQSNNSYGLSISGNGFGCNTITGDFRVRKIVYNGNQISELWATFEQHCDGAVPALRGELRHFVSDTTLYFLPPPDVYAHISEPITFNVSAVETRGRPVTLGAAGLPMGATFTDHGDGTGTFSWPTGALVEGTITIGLLSHNDRVTVNSVTVIHVIGDDRLHMVSDPGDYIGQGRTWDYNEANMTLVPAGNFQNGASFNLTSGSEWWYLNFAGPNNEPLHMGSYTGATRFPFNSTGPGLDVSGNGRGCNMLTGQFDVMQVEYGPDGVPTTFWATFEQHCEGAVPALRGEICFGKGVVTPVTISLADVEAEPGHVLLTWYAAERGFEANVERRTTNGAWSRLGAVTSDGAGWLRYADRDVVAGENYAYRLAYSRAGQEEFTSELWVEVPNTLALALGGLQPNPAVAELVAAFTLPRAEPASLDLIDLAGRRIVSKDVGSLGAGNHRMRIAESGAVSPGVYWLVLQQGSERKVTRALVIR
jgi:hypothetical protein